MEIIFWENLTELFQGKALMTAVILVAIALVLVAVTRKAKFNARLISYGAISIAFAFLLSFIKLFQLPNGGTITIASMLPIFLFASIAGPWAGMTAGLCYGMLQFIQGPFFVHPVQFMLDYPLAFALLGAAGFFRKNIALGGLIGGLGRFICHFLSGVVFFGEYANGQNVFLYSFLYNASYLVPEIAICMLIMSIPSVKNAMKRIAGNGYGMNGQ